MKDTTPKEKPKRNKRTNKDWVIIREYPTLEGALQEIKSENTWSKYSANKNYTVFRCNRVRKNSLQCKSGLRLKLHEKDVGVTLYASRNPHNCHELEQASGKMTTEIKFLIESLYNKGLRRKDIEEELVLRKIPLPAQHVLQNEIARLRRNDDGQVTITVAQLKQILEQHLDVPEDQFKAFVLDFKIQDSHDSIRFDFVVSCKKLLELNLKSQVFNADTTHKLIWQGYSVQITGHTDYNKKFHPSLVSVSTSEDEEAFAFVFGALKETSIKVFQKEWKPPIIISNGSKAISNAFRRICGEDSKVLMCWSHAKCKIVDNVQQFIPKERQGEIIQDINFLQLAQNPVLFDKASSLFLEKYKDYPNFIEYFTQQWLHLHRNWYEGACVDLGIKAPSCNNGLEVFSRTVKDEKTLRHRLPLQQLIHLLFVWIETWAKRYEAGATTYYENVNLDLPTEARGYQWTGLKKEIRKHHTGDFYMVPAGNTLTLDDWTDTLRWDTFEEYRINVFKGWSIKFINHPELWTNSTCNCPSFLKEYMCKHIYGIAICLQIVQPSTAAKQILVDKKRGRGRPKLVK